MQELTVNEMQDVNGGLLWLAIAGVFAIGVAVGFYTSCKQ